MPKFDFVGGLLTDEETDVLQLRHTFVSIASALPEGQLKQIVGHSKNMDTFGVYGHAVNGQAEKIASAIDETFKDVLKSTH